MSLFTRKTRPPMTVEIVIQGMIAGRYVSVAETVEMPTGATVRDLLAELRRLGHLDADAHAVLRDVPEPLSLLVNGEGVVGRGRAKRPLAAGDQVAVLVPVSGG